jgi:hypothetical protein
LSAWLRCLGLAKETQGIGYVGFCELESCGNAPGFFVYRDSLIDFALLQQLKGPEICEFWKIED